MPTKSIRRLPKAAPQTFDNIYYVTRPFKYGKRTYKNGDQFVPAGGKFDRQLMEHNCRMKLEIAEASV